MAKYILRKRFKFPIGHRLSKHEGLCKNIHGHNIVCEIALWSNQLNYNDMVIDFGDVKKMMNPVLEMLDHCFLVNSDDYAEIDHLQKNNRKYILFKGDPTAELLSEYIYEFVDLNLPSGVNIHSIRVWENENADIEYIVEDET